MATPDTVYVGGSILPVGGPFATVEAVAVTNGRISSVGPQDAVMAAAGSATAVVELAGRTMVPGLHEPHAHPLHLWDEYLNAAVLRPPPLGDVTSMSLLCERLAERAAATRPGEWVVGSRYDELSFTDDQRVPTRHDLDAISTQHPILIVHRSGHTNVASTLALELAGVTAASPDPSGGVIGRDAHGVPTGVLQYQPALALVHKVVPKPTDEQHDLTLDYAASLMMAAGITALHDAATIRDADIAAYRRAIDRGAWPVRTTLMPFHAVAFDIDGRPALSLGDRGDEFLKTGPVKLLADGSVPGFTGWLKEEPYLQLCDCVANYGGPAMSPERFIDVVRRVHCSGRQVAIHAGGDGAVDLVIEAVRAAQADEPRADARHRIEHCHVVRPDQLDAIAELGMTISFFVSHTWFWGDRYISHVLGPERSARIDPVREALDRGIRCSIHSDAPHVPAEPLMSMFCAVNRITHGGQPIGPANAITPAEALRCVTLDAAYQAFDDDRIGSIEVGKLADFTVLAENPLTVPVEHLRHIAVDEVIVGGASVFRR